MTVDWSGPEIPNIPVPRPVLARWRRYALSRPWSGDTPLLDGRHRLDTWGILDPDRPIRLMLSLDVGYHASGWFKNPGYEQCLHLSLSSVRRDLPVAEFSALGFRHVGMQVEAVPEDEAREWSKALFGQWWTLAWYEPPASLFDPYRAPGVGHLRLYIDRATGQPFMPEGEVYSTTMRPWSPKVAESAGGDVR